jgi:hypothetical protein
VHRKKLSELKAFVTTAVTPLSRPEMLLLRPKYHG